MLVGEIPTGRAFGSTWRENQNRRQQSTPLSGLYAHVRTCLCPQEVGVQPATAFPTHFEVAEGLVCIRET